MPRLSAWTLRIALLYLLAGFTIGALLLANKGLPYWPQVWALLPVHIEFLIVGWMIQLALAVAFWILPRFPNGSRGNKIVAVASIIILNIGIFLIAFQERSSLFLLFGRACEALSGILFTWHAWHRIRPLKIH